MTVDRYRISKLITSAKRVEAVMMSPSDSDQDRQGLKHMIN